MTVWDVVGTGFDGTFVPRGERNVGIGVLQPLSPADVQWRVRRMHEVVLKLQPETGFQDRHFVDLSVGAQRMTLLMRALVGRPQLVFLDEVWSGMDHSMVEAARRYLREGGIDETQACVVITHWDQEVPWTADDALRRFILRDGIGTVE